VAIVTGTRRHADYVVARPAIRTLAIASAFASLGNLLAIGCAYAWLQQDGGMSGYALAMFAVAAGAQFLAGVLAAVVYGWSR
jgi:hypothetical protein